MTSRLRAAAVLVICALVGFAAGTLAGVKAHTTTGAFPSGFVLSLVLVLLLVLALRLGLRGRRFGAAGGVGLLAGSAVLALPSAGGSIVLPLDGTGIGWLAGVAAAAAVAVAIPVPAAPRGPRHADGILADDERTET